MIWENVFKLPFKLSYGDIYVFDSNDHIVCNITEQDDYAVMIVNALNGWEITFPNKKFNASDGCIFDGVNEDPVIVIRGWGYLTGTGGLNLAPEQAVKIQDELQGWIVKRLNGEV